MPICSYLIYPLPGQKQLAQSALAAHPACVVYPAENDNLLILVTDTESPMKEKELHVFLNEVPQVACMSLAYAHSEEDCHAASS